MNPKYTHDFSSASVKHLIEAEFYQKAGSSLGKSSSSATIVTGPDYQRHLDNFRKYIGDKKLRICEIDPIIYTDIKRGLAHENQYKVLVENKSIELYGSSFIDCDLTCVSDLEVIKNTLLKQINVQASNCSNNKAFIFSFSLRTQSVKTLLQYIRPIWGLLGSHVVLSSMKRANILQETKKNRWINQFTISGTKGRIKDYILYEYNAGGGPMLTCLLIYK